MSAIIDERIFLNGIDALNGEYLQPPLELRAAAELARAERVDTGRFNLLTRLERKLTQPRLGLPWDVDPIDLSRAGWGVVLPQYATPGVQSEIAVLVDHRRRVIGDARVKVLDYRLGEEWESWLDRNGTSPGTVDPTKVPYYLLLVGDPGEIPFEFQSQLDVEYAVGRLDLGGPEALKTYVASLIQYETSAATPHGDEAVFFATRHPGDRSTQLSAEVLVRPLAEGVTGPDGKPTPPVAEPQGFTTLTFLGNEAGKEATKASLLGVLTAERAAKPPALLFTATHGLGWPKGHPDQVTHQGALLCQDWPGFGRRTAGYHVTATDVPDEARVHGMVSFHFACYGGGTPERDTFHRSGEAPAAVADLPFVAALPKRLLAHPKGGALGVIAHVDRVWGYSLGAPLAGPQLLPFSNALGRILAGQPIGHAMTDFNHRYSALSTSLATMLQRITYFEAVYPEEKLALTWMERNDAQNYILLGDPAARLRKPR